MIFLFPKGEKSGAFGKSIFSHAADCKKSPEILNNLWNPSPKRNPTPKRNPSPKRTLSEIRNCHLNKAPQKLQPVKYDYDAAYDVDYTESLVGNLSTEQRNDR